MLLVGLTGGIATGKSYVADLFSYSGIPVVDLDSLSRKVVEPGLPAWERIKKNFGSEYFDPDTGELDRRLLGELVFRNPEKRRQLNHIVHPYIRWEMLKALIQLALRGNSIAIIDSPLLFETGGHRLVQLVIVVACDENNQKKRLMMRDGFSEQEAAERISSQMPLKEKCSRANFVVDNNYSLENTESQVAEIISDFRNRSALCRIPGLMMILLYGCVFLIQRIYLALFK